MAFTLEDLQHFEYLALAASEGPWEVDAIDAGTPFNVDLPNGDSVALAAPVPGDYKNEQRMANAQFIAGLNPEIVLAMVSQLRMSLKD